MNNRIDSIKNPSFDARIVFKKVNTAVKPYVAEETIASRITPFVKTKEPSFFVKLIFGIKKKTKLPSLRRN